MSKKILPYFVLALILALALAACGGGEPQVEEAAPEEQTQEEAVEETAEEAPAEEETAEEEAAEEPAEEEAMAESGLPDLGGREITIAVENQYLPYNYIDPDTGDPAGWDYDVWDELCQLLNCTPTYVEASWEGMIQAVADGQFDAAADGITITEDRAEIVDFSNGYMAIEIRLLVRLDEDRIESIEDIVENEELVLGTQVGTTNYEVASQYLPTERIEAFELFPFAVQALIAGDVDAVIIDETAGQGYKGENADVLKIVGPSLSSDQLGFIYPKGSDLVEPVNLALQELATNGFMDEVNAKFFGPDFNITYDDLFPPEDEVAEEAAAEEEMAMADCEPATDGPLAGVDPRDITVVWWHQHSGSREEGLMEMIDEFNSTNPCGITIEAQNQGGYDEIRDKMNASIGAGEAPAALIVGYQNDQAFYQLNEGLADLNIYVDDEHWGLTEEEKADFFSGFFNQSVHPVFDNQRLGFPPNRSIEVLYYNQTWLEELGFEGPPATPEEFREMACAAAEANGDGTGGYILRDDASGVAAWTLAFGGDVLDESGTAYNYANDATVEAMTFLKGMLDDGCAYFFTEGFPNPEFAGRRAIFTQGSSSGMSFYAGDVATVAEEEGREPDVWGVAAIPHTTADPVMNVYGGDIMITANTPEQELAAWQFIKWYTSPEIQAWWDSISGYFPTRQGTTEFLGDFIGQSEFGPQYEQAIDLLQYGAYEPQLISYQAVRDQAQEAFNAIMQGADIEATLQDLTESANELQAELMEEIGG
ncbi:MAG: extracellular solute-binding protein [Candidatus Promineifilaceae bacterium]|nr:extracellular solute-binding protein [Candidatus Promineifilaceae bacterium]